MKPMKVKVKVNHSHRGIPKGSIIEIGSLKHPYDGFWKRRLHESKIDNCLTKIESYEKEQKSKIDDCVTKLETHQKKQKTKKTEELKHVD